MSECIYPLCNCYAFHEGNIVPFKEILGYWKSCGHGCEQSECEWPNCECAMPVPADGFKHCERSV